MGNCRPEVHLDDFQCFRDQVSEGQIKLVEIDNVLELRSWDEFVTLGFE